MTITQLPTAPSRSDPSDIFDDRADAWVAALPPWTDEVNAIAIEIDADSTSASASAISASASAISASASAVTALSAPGTSATSTTPVSIGLGSKSFVIQTGKDFVSGMILIAADDAAPTTNRMIGGITNYNSGTGELVIDVDSFGGSGTISAWTISISGRPGIDGSANIVEDTTPQLGGQLDVNGFDIGDGTRELLSFTEDVSAVNHINITNAASGIGPIISSFGDNDDIDLNISGKGTGKINISSPLKPNGNYIGSDKGSDISASAFDLSTISAVQATESVASEDINPSGISFNNDGSKIYMIGVTNASIHEYNLSTNFDLSTISAVQATESIFSEDTSPSGIIFNNDGSKIYIVGLSSSSIHEYNLSTNFDLSTISAVQVTRSVSSEDNMPTGIAFNNDGSKIYMIGFTSDSIHEYNLSTQFDISTISAVQVTRSVASEDINPSGISFNNDGSKIYMIGVTSDSIHEYNLSTNFDLSTISAVQVTRSVSSEDAIPGGIAFNNSGSKIYMIGEQNDSIHEYNLGELFNLIALSSIQVTKSISSEDTDPRGITFNNDGSKIYMVGANNASIHEYNLSTNFDLSTISAVQVTRSVSSEDTSPTGMIFNNSGSKIFVVGSQNDSIYEYNLDTPFDISTISAVQVTQSVSSEDGTPFDIAFNNDGSKIYMVGGINASIHEYNLSTNFDLSTISAVQVTRSVSSEDGNPRGIAFSNNGSKIFMTGSSLDQIYEYILSTPFDLSTITPVQVTEPIADTLPRGITFNNDGSKIFLVGGQNDSIYEYNLTTALLTVGDDGDYFDVVGTSDFSGIVTDSGRNFTLQFDDILTIIVGSGITLNNAGLNYTTTNGDIIHFQSTEINTVVGTISKSDGTSTVVNGAGSWDLIGSIVANDNTTLAITGLDSNYETYAISLSQIRPTAASAASLLSLRTGTTLGIDSGAGDYSYHTSTCSSNASTYSASSNNSTNSILVGLILDTSNHFLTSLLYMQRSTVSDGVIISGITGSLDTSGSVGGHIIGYSKSVVDVDRVQIFFDSGNISSGRMTIWGISSE